MFSKSLSWHALVMFGEFYADPQHAKGVNLEKIY